MKDNKIISISFKGSYDIYNKIDYASLPLLTIIFNQRTKRKYKITGKSIDNKDNIDLILNEVKK